jgi:hypothetical protein
MSEFTRIPDNYVECPHVKHVLLTLTAMNMSAGEGHQQL